MITGLIHRNIFTYSQQEGSPAQYYSSNGAVICSSQVFSTQPAQLSSSTPSEKVLGVPQIPQQPDLSDPTCPKKSSIFLLTSTLLHFGQATSLNSMVTPTACLVQQGVQSTAKQNAQNWELSHKNTMVLGSTSVDKCLQNLFIFVQTKQPLYFFLCIKEQLNRSYTLIDSISIMLH